MIKKNVDRCGDSYMCVLVAHSCPILCNPMGCSLPGSSAQGILRARILEWVAISFSSAEIAVEIRDRPPGPQTMSASKPDLQAILPNSFLPFTNNSPSLHFYWVSINPNFIHSSSFINMSEKSITRNSVVWIVQLSIFIEVYNVNTLKLNGIFQQLIRHKLKKKHFHQINWKTKMFHHLFIWSLSAYSV